MPIIYLKLIMIALVIALCVIVFMGVRVMRGLSALWIPRVRMPDVRLQDMIPKREPTLDEWLTELEVTEAEEAEPLHRSRQPAALPEGPDRSDGVETFLEETLRSLEQAFESFESGRIGVDTYRSLLHSVRRAARKRKAGMEAQRDLAAPGEFSLEGDLSESIAAVDAVEWCLDWLTQFERGEEQEAA